ncbi:arf-GAP domain and FG repeat-containing protein 1 isoform X2 [Anthonomus grandis grandis]|uniref:arf-GAP domain and FG repeat-containing protein 1 isoform X2 n=1 Tax=Anthonomus grandis grandis TaxID=2921223 RepID=UPI0021650CFD|nr:arf-GAP domain and FG repeat-containing protein 1 isoform X2 [Anthonomus grandis grandis]
MASSRKKQDESNLKTLRELASLAQNKFCFDCGQRGPTYVNVTVGSFVCTKCSGILRGITPPHRVKSISMATFTPEEIDTIKNKGNAYCKKVWLGLYEGTPPTSTDEQSVRDFMLEKYEKKRYYLENKSAMTKPEVPNTRPWISTPSNGNSPKLNGMRNGVLKTNSNNNITNGTSRSRPEVKNPHQNGVKNNNLGNFAVDFDKADIFSNISTSSNSSSQSFADFEHNQVYNASNSNGMPALGSPNPWITQSQNGLLPVQNGVNHSMQNGINHPTPNGVLPVQNGLSNAPVEDKYAALKDLDNEMKQQQQQDVWSTTNTGSTGSLYSSSTPNTGSAYGSPSPQGSIFGSPSQGQFMSSFANLQPDTAPAVPNPFGNNQWPVANGFSNGMNGSQGFANPFNDQPVKINGFSNGFQPMFPSNGLNHSGWGGNPFKMGAVATSMNPNNPFL